jgi:hypothetical protein
MDRIFPIAELADSKASEDAPFPIAHGPAPRDWLFIGWLQYAALSLVSHKAWRISQAEIYTFISTAIEKNAVYSSFRYDFKMMLEYKLGLLRECLEDRF